MDDEGSFKKARGFLFTYSCLVVGLCYFKAELTQFNLMGVAITFSKRQESIWLVVALVNAYFWFRFYQHLPRNALCFDEAMNDLYDEALVWLSLRCGRREVRSEAEKVVKRFAGPPEQTEIGWYSAKAIGRSSLADAKKQNEGKSPELHQVSREYRTTMSLSFCYRFTENGKWLHKSEPIGISYRPGRAITWTAKAFAFLKGAFVTPWFTDYVAPLVLGGISITTALWRWWEVNFISGGI